MDLIAIQEMLGPRLGSHHDAATSTSTATHIEDAWIAGQQRAAARLEGLM